MFRDKVVSTIGRVHSTLSQDDLPAFFVLTFGISWAFWLPMALVGLPSPGLRILGTFGPALAALTVLAITAGRAGLREIGRRLLIWRVGTGWYLVSLLSTAAIVLLAVGIHLMLDGSGLQ